MEYLGILQIFQTINTTKQIELTQDCLFLFLKFIVEEEV
jgi:hypothetical protein